MTTLRAARNADATRAVHHIALGAFDVELVAAFYRDVIGLEERARHSDESGRLRSIWLDAQGVILMVERTEQPARRVDGVGHGHFLLAFGISPEERAKYEETLEARGFTIESRSDFTSYSRDPEGNRVALCHYPSAGGESSRIVDIEKTHA